MNVKPESLVALFHNGFFSWEGSEHLLAKLTQDPDELEKVQKTLKKIKTIDCDDKHDFHPGILDDDWRDRLSEIEHKVTKRNNDFWNNDFWNICVNCKIDDI